MKKILSALGLGGLAAAGAAVTLALPAAAKVTVAASGSTPYISGASGSPVDAGSSSVSVSIGTQSTNLVEDVYQPCTLYVNSNSAAAGGGAQTFGLSAGQGSWSGTVGFAPGQTLYVQLAISKDGCSTLSYSNIVSFSVAALPATTTTTTSTGGTTTTTSGGTTTTTSGGTTTTTSGTVAPTAPPVAAFTTAVTGLSVTFTDTSTATAPATISTVTWLFGDGMNATGPTATHAYTSAGTFTVVEIVTDSNGLTDRTSQDETVSPFGGKPAFAETASPLLSSTASKLFGFQVAVFCVRSWGGAKPERGLGLSIVGSRQANVAQAICAAIAKRTPTGIQLLALNHEVGHALGITAERSADCYGLKKLPGLEQALRISDRGQRTQASRYITARWGGCH